MFLQGLSSVVYDFLCKRTANYYAYLYLNINNWFRNYIPIWCETCELYSCDACKGDNLHAKIYLAIFTSIPMVRAICMGCIGAVAIKNCTLTSMNKQS